MNYNEKFTQISYELTEAIRAGKTFMYNGADCDVADRPTRIKLIERISYDYMTEHAAYVQPAIDRWFDKGAKGERPVTPSPDTALLERLADAILYEELTDTHPDKMTREEYPIMSMTQESRRRDREYSLSLADNYDLDGVNRAKPERRHRTAKEHRFVDKVARDKNRKRSAQYKRDTSAGPVIPYATEPFVNCRGIGEKWRDTLSLVY
jgi:hypothetical protein